MYVEERDTHWTVVQLSALNLLAWMMIHSSSLLKSSSRGLYLLQLRRVSQFSPSRRILIFIYFISILDGKEESDTTTRNPLFFWFVFFLPNSPSKNGWQDAAAYLPFNVAMQSIDREVYCFLFFVVVPITYLAFFMWTKEKRTEEKGSPAGVVCYESSADENENLCCTFPSLLYDYFRKSVCR